MSFSVYDTFSSLGKPNPMAATNGAPLSGRDRTVLQTRGIDPDGAIARARGYRTVSADEAQDAGFVGSNARAGLLIPIYNLAGEIDGYMLRPHDPVVDPKTGKSRKYLFAAGKTPALGGTPAGTVLAESRTHQLRENLDTPVIVTESMIKGDSILSHADRDVYTLSIHGTWNWSVNGAPSPELRNIPWRRKQGDRVVFRRQVILVPDSDYATKPEVAFAWWTFGRMLQDRNADVRIFHLPTAADGSKLGPDDALVSGAVTVAQMIDGSVPLGEMPQHAQSAPSWRTDPDHMITEQARHIWQLEELIVNPFLTPNEKVAMVQALRNAVVPNATRDDDGMVEISPIKISNDARPTDKTRDDYEEFARSPLNPDGTPWYMRRSTVSSVTKSLASKIDNVQAFKAVTKVVRNPGDPSPRRESSVLVKPDNVISILVAANAYRPGTAKPRTYKTTPPCPHCGEVHGKTIVTICGTHDDPGCGAITEKEVPAILPEHHPDPVNTKNVFTDSHSDTHLSSPAGGPIVKSSQKMCLPADEPDTPLMPTCDYGLAPGEKCGNPTEDWITGGYGSKHLCEYHAELTRNGGRRSA